MLSSKATPENGKKTITGLISKKSNFAGAAHFFCTFLCRCFSRLQREASRNFLVRRFMKEMSYAFSFTIFSLPLIFTLHWWPLAFLILSPPLQNFHVVLPANRCLFRFFYLSLSITVALFLVELRQPTFSFSLSFSCSIFQICGHDNLSTLNNLDNTDTETIFAFHFRLY